MKSRQLINNLTYLFRFAVYSNISCQNNPCKHNVGRKYACHVFDTWKFCKSPHNGLCASCESHNKNVVCPSTTSTGFTCNGDCVLCELKINIFICYLLEYGGNPLSPRIKWLSSLIIFSFIYSSSHISCVYPFQAAKAREILLKLFATVIRSRKLLEWFPLIFNT